MNCREFRRKHDAYVDDTLSGVDFDGMARHRQLCERCAQLDTRVRRALLVARNLPTIRPSAAFNDRLQARLSAERTSGAPWHGDEAPGSYLSASRRSRPATYAVVVTAVATVAALAGLASHTSSRDDVIHLAPVVASRPASEPSTFATSTIVASMPAGMPLWSAVFVAQQAPWHFASDAAAR